MHHITHGPHEDLKLVFETFLDVVYIHKVQVKYLFIPYFVKTQLASIWHSLWPTVNETQIRRSTQNGEHFI
jgi:hypothetical protein